jgi:DNA-binding CsgD family transcriptional regulator
MQAPFADPLPGIARVQATQRLPLVGRSWEMQIISSLLETVAFDRPTGARALMVSGEVGAGKSRLLAEMREKALEGSFQVLDGRVYESGGVLPYLPFVEALRPVIRTTPIEILRTYLGLQPDRLDSTEAKTPTSGALLSLVGVPMMAALARLFPELPGRVQVTPQSEVLSQDREKFRLFDAIATLLERMAREQPVLLSIDNLQWADSASLELTLYLTVRLHQSRVALAGVTRSPGSLGAGISAQPGDAVPAAMAIRTIGELVRQGLLMLLPLGPLSHDETEQYLHALLPGEVPASLAAALHERAEGNPFFLEELVRMLTMRGHMSLRDGTWHLSQPIGTGLPQSIYDAVEQRLQGLSLPCRERLRAAALFGRAFPLAALAAVLDESAAQTQSFIEEAVQAGVLVAALPDDLRRLDGQMNEEGLFPRSALPTPHARGDYLFGQGIVQEVLCSQVPAHRARELHGEIGEALEAWYGAVANAAELAYHYTLGKWPQHALRWSVLAGEEALRRQAYREAIGHFRAALIFLTEQAVPFDGEQGIHMLPAPVQLYLWIGQSWFKLGDLKQAMEAFQQALERYPFNGQRQAGQPDLLLAQINRHMSDIYRMQGKYDQALSHLQAAGDAIQQALARGEDTERGVTTTERILQLQAQAMLDVFLARPALAEQAYWQSHRLATGIGDRESQAFALHMVGWIRGWGKHIHEAIRYQEQAYALYTALGDQFRASLVDQGLGIIYQALGEVEQARLHTLRGLERARRYGVRNALGWLYYNQAIMALVEGNWQACDSYLQQAAQEADTLENARLNPVVLETRAEMYFRIGDWREAEHLFLAAIQSAVNTEWHQSAMALYGHFLAVTGRNAEAKVQLGRASALPESTGYSGHFYIPFLAEGYLHLGNSAQATKYVERIRDLHGFMYYGMAVDRILGQVAVQEGDQETADRAFEDALALCRKVHNQPEEATILYEQARASLHFTRGQATPASLSRIHALCNRAREIFQQYQMSRAVDMVDTLQEGIAQISRRERSVSLQKQGKEALSEYRLDQHLTRREQEVLRLVAEGYTDREVADTLVISHRTVNRHLSNIFVKLDVPGRAAAVAYAIRQGLVG